MLNEKIYEFMCEKGYSQRSLAKATGISEVSISRYVKGTRTPPLKIIKTLAIVFNCNISDLVSDEELDVCEKNDKCKDDEIYHQTSPRIRFNDLISKETIYRCMLCEKSFETKSLCIKHLQNIHQIRRNL